MIWLNLLFFIVACATLVTSATFLVKSLSKIAQFLHVSEYTVAFILMAAATSVPEFFVGISSALAKNTELCLGNVIGANIANIGLIGAIIILLARSKIKTKTERIRKDSFYMLLIAILPLVLFWIGKLISRIDGIILLAVFFFYSWRLMKRRKKNKKFVNKLKKWEIVLYPVVFVVALILLLLSADFVVKYATLIADQLALPYLVMGLFFVALGTTLPELTFESRAVLMGHHEMALGNLIGSIIVNSTLVLGMAALIYPITAPFALFLLSAVFMLIFCFLFAIFVKSGERLYAVEGVVLLLLYILFVIIEFLKV